MEAAPITLAERLQKVATGRLYARMNVAQGALLTAINPRYRLNAINEIEAIRNELKRRGAPPKGAA